MNVQGQNPGFMRVFTLLLMLLLGSVAWAETPVPTEGSVLPTLAVQVAPGAQGTVLVVFRSADW